MDRRTQFQLQAMMLPATLLVLLFCIVPLFGILIAFKDYRPVSGVAGIFTSPWNNFKNFEILFRNYDFWPMLKNTLGINLLNNLISIPVTLFFALMLNEVLNARFKSLIQTVTYMPHFLSWVVFGGLFMTLLSTDNGFVNTILMNLGIIREPIGFMSEPKYFWAISAVTSLLKELGWGAILYIAAIAGVDQELYEAASIDGAGKWRQFFSITVPLITPVIFYNLVTQLCQAFQEFNGPFIITQGGPRNATMLISMLIYNNAFKSYEMGMASAQAWLLFLIVMTFTAVAFISQKKWVYYSDEDGR